MTVNEAGFVGVGSDLNVGTLITGGSAVSPARSIIRFKAGTNTYFSGMVFSETYAANSLATKLFLGANSNINSNALVKHIAIDGSNGNVGIGTETPSRKLHVAGSLYADSLNLAPGIWNTSAEATPKNRIFFASDSITYLQGHGAVPLIVRNGSDADMLEIRSSGTMKVAGPLFVGAGSSSDGRRLLSANYDGSVEGHFVSGLVSERSTSAIGLSWGMYQDNTTSWLSGWNYASVRRTALLLDHGSIRFIASPTATTATPGVALPSQPTTVFYVDSIGQLLTTGSVSCRYGLHIADLDGANAGISQWLTYKIAGVGQPLNIRDMVNSRQHMQFYPGATAAASLLYVDSKLRCTDSINIGIKTIATLPSAASSSGERYQLSDSATIVNRIAFSNGTAWYYEGTAVAV
jgi:hypothetical protein